MISVIIPSYRSQATIEDCLRSLQRQVFDQEYEILVVNSSADETPCIVKKNWPFVRIFQIDQRVYAGTARNQGIREARGNILAFMDADCQASPLWLSRIFSWHQRGYKVVGGSLLNLSRDNCYSRAEYPLEIQEFSPQNPRREVKFVSAANCSFSRDIFDEHGFFPEVRAGEDLLLCHKIVTQGEKILFDPEIRVSHKNEIDLNTFLSKQIMHGKYSFIIRRMARLSGSLLSRAYVLLLLLPLLPFLRASRIILRSLTLRNALILDIFQIFPLFILGCMMWSAGFLKGYIEHVGSAAEISIIQATR